MSYLKESARWEPNIYRIEKTDPLLGGEYGIVNVPAKQLANRTLYLLAYFLQYHNADGAHYLKNADVAANAGIPESCFAFPESTKALARELAKYDAEYDKLYEALENLSISSGTPISALFEALKLSWKYAGVGYDFCLFTDSYSFVDGFDECAVVSTIKGDDSIDVEDSAKVREGEHYLFTCDELETPLNVIIKAILSEQRVLLDIELPVTTTSGMLRRSTWDIQREYANAGAGQIMMTRPIDTLQNYRYGILSITHDVPGQPFEVAYRHTPDGDWLKASYEGTVQDNDLYQSTFRVDAGDILYFRITALVDCKVDHMAVYAPSDSLAGEFVRSPNVYEDLTLTRYGAVYKDPFAALEIILWADGDSEEAETVMLTDVDLVSPVVDVYDALAAKKDLVPGTTYHWKARYHSASGKFSAYSLTTSFTAV